MRSAFAGATLFLLLCSLPGCGSDQPSVSVTIDIQHRPAAVPPETDATELPAAATLLPAATTEASGVAVSTETPADPLVQYRLWIEEARQAHPYDESAGQMWQVMLCESSGNPLATADPYIGLFQYLPATWQGEWNPYREASITDARAQIFATAKAWQDGNQHWWGCYGR